MRAAFLSTMSFENTFFEVDVESPTVQPCRRCNFDCVIMSLAPIFVVCKNFRNSWAAKPPPPAVSDSFRPINFEL